MIGYVIATTEKCIHRLFYLNSVVILEELVARIYTICFLTEIITCWLKYEKFNPWTQKKGAPAELKINLTPFRQQRGQQRLCFVKTSVHDRIQSISKFTDKLLNSSGTRYWFKLFKHYPNNLSLVFLRATHTFLSPAWDKGCKIYCDHYMNLSFIFFLLQTDL